MSEESSDWERWRVEHARDPETETTPLMAAASRGGRTLFYRHLGETGRDALRDAEGVSCPSFGSDDAVVALGRRLADAVDDEAVPSRLELHQRLVDEDEVEPDELVADRVGEAYRLAMVEQVGVERVAELARAAAEE